MLDGVRDVVLAPSLTETDAALVNTRLVLDEICGRVDRAELRGVLAGLILGLVRITSMEPLMAPTYLVYQAQLLTLRKALADDVPWESAAETEIISQLEHEINT